MREERGKYSPSLVIGQPKHLCCICTLFGLGTRWPTHTTEFSMAREVKAKLDIGSCTPPRFKRVGLLFVYLALGTKFKLSIRLRVPPLLKRISLFLGYLALAHQAIKTILHGFRPNHGTVFRQFRTHLTCSLGKGSFQCFFVYSSSCVLLVDFTDSVQQCPTLSLGLVVVPVVGSKGYATYAPDQ